MRRQPARWCRRAVGCSCSLSQAGVAANCLLEGGRARGERLIHGGGVVAVEGYHRGTRRARRSGCRRPCRRPLRRPRRRGSRSRTRVPLWPRSWSSLGCWSRLGTRSGRARPRRTAHVAALRRSARSRPWCRVRRVEGHPDQGETRGDVDDEAVAGGLERGSAARVSRIGADRFSAICASTSASAMASSHPARTLPALLTSTSRPPNASSAAAATASALPVSVRSAEATCACAPASRTSAATSSVGSVPRLTRASLAPTAASCSAGLRPLPLPAPVSRIERLCRFTGKP